jgi:cell division protein FtsL
MAASQRWYRSTLPTEPAWPTRERVPDRPGTGPRRHKVAGRKRRFAVLVVLPVLMMLGSVYAHTVAAGLDGKAAGLEEKLDRARAERERLEVEVAGLSGADRIRPLARKRLGLQDAASNQLEVYRGTPREDGIGDGGEEKGGEPRRR